MKILLDECAPRLLKKELSGHDVRTVQEMGWAGIKNGELLSLTERHFEAFVTTDKNLRHQQNLAGRTFAVVILPSNRLLVVKKLIPAIESALTKIQPGSIVELPPLS